MSGLSSKETARCSKTACRAGSCSTDECTPLSSEMTACIATLCVNGKLCVRRLCRPSITSSWCFGFMRKTSQRSLPMLFKVSHLRPSAALSTRVGMRPRSHSRSLYCLPFSASLWSTAMDRQRTSSGTSNETDKVCNSGTTAPDSKKAFTKDCSWNSKKTKKTLSCKGNSYSIGSVKANHDVSRTKKRCAECEKSDSMLLVLLCCTTSRRSSSISFRRRFVALSNSCMHPRNHCSPGAAWCARLNISL
mmetsp:Transcript_45287/g.105068  ORF Transcript_45287/g.105068 Transcript_45287/m.105068 type:complete len:248 (+) Transcript_45287:2356-3099(+)